MVRGQVNWILQIRIKVWFEKFSRVTEMNFDCLSASQTWSWSVSNYTNNILKNCATCQLTTMPVDCVLNVWRTVVICGGIWWHGTAIGTSKALDSSWVCSPCSIIFMHHCSVWPGNSRQGNIHISFHWFKIVNSFMPQVVLKNCNQGVYFLKCEWSF